MKAEFTVCLVLLPLETFNSLKAHLAPGPESAAGHSPIPEVSASSVALPSWHTTARRPFHLRALEEAGDTSLCFSLENTSQTRTCRQQSKSSPQPPSSRSGCKIGGWESGSQGSCRAVRAMNELPSWKAVCSGPFCKCPSFIAPTGPGIRMSLANEGHRSQWQRSRARLPG